MGLMLQYPNSFGLLRARIYSTKLLYCLYKGQCCKQLGTPMYFKNILTFDLMTVFDIGNVFPQSMSFFLNPYLSQLFSYYTSKHPELQQYSITTQFTFVSCFFWSFSPSISQDSACVNSFQGHNSFPTINPFHNIIKCS